ncbi:MAG: serine/threonine-protein kinase [Gemmatales bacterium]|nr:serine/threonine-protein kinase [Gemmatales bacterium]
MQELTASNLAQRVVQLGLVRPEQIEDTLQELPPGSNGENLLRALERRGLLTGLQIEKLRRGDTTGYFLGGYALKYKIAAGTFGRVFRAEDPNNGQAVAIKVLRRRWTEDKNVVELFIREACLGMSLKHPNIVQTLMVDHDKATDQHFMVMEFVEGGNLRDMLTIRKRFDVAETLRLLEDMASGLAYAFSRGITHRDLKPSNVLLSAQGTAKLVDFGLAQIFRLDESLLSEEERIQVQRTLDYAGLEKATNAPPNDTRSDIFFLGCIAYEMLTGRPALQPTRQRHLRASRERFLNVPQLQPEEAQGFLPLVHLVRSMMALDPQMRPQTPQQLLDQIRHVRSQLSKGNSQDTTVSAVIPSGITVFVVERHENLQELIREKFKKLGYRVLLSTMPERMLERFAQQPFQGAVVDVGSVGEEGVQALKQVVEQAQARNLPLTAIAIVSENQDALADQLAELPQIEILRRPLNLGQLVRALTQSLPPKL